MIPDQSHKQITRRDALRAGVLFSAGMLASGMMGRVQAAAAPTTKFAGQGLDLLAFGDFGTRGDLRQVAIAEQMATFAGSLDQPLTAVLALGDNFYKPLTPDRFVNHFEKMYDEKALACPFYACLGNHDYGPSYDFQEGKLQMQLDYAKNNPGSRWKMPAKWYSLELPSDGEPLVKIVTLDSNFWEGAMTPQEKIAQRHWLKDELAKETKAKWLWVVSHYPMYSQCAKNGRGDNQPLIREWGELFKKYNVSLYLAGHDHDLQHLRVDGYPTSFMVSGGGGAESYECNASTRGYTGCTLGFNHIHVTPERLEVQCIDAKGDCLHAFSQDRDGKVDVKAAA